MTNKQNIMKSQTKKHIGVTQNRWNWIGIRKQWRLWRVNRIKRYEIWIQIEADKAERLQHHDEKKASGIKEYFIISIIARTIFTFGHPLDLFWCDERSASSYSIHWLTERMRRREREQRDQMEGKESEREGATLRKTFLIIWFHTNSQCIHTMA